MSDRAHRRSARDESSCNKGRVYNQKCMFRLRVTKYPKGPHTLEASNPAADLRADKTVRDIATARMEEKVLAVTARYIVAGETV